MFALFTHSSAFPLLRNIKRISFQLLYCSKCGSVGKQGSKHCPAQRAGVFEAPVLVECCQPCLVSRAQGELCMEQGAAPAIPSRAGSWEQLMEPSSRTCLCPCAPSLLPFPAPACKAALLLTAAWADTAQNNSYLLEQVNELERSTKERRETALGVLWVHRGEMCRQLCRTSASGLSWGITAPVCACAALTATCPQNTGRQELTLLSVCGTLLGAGPGSYLRPWYPPGPAVPAEAAIPWLSLSPLSPLLLLFLALFPVSHTSCNCLTDSFENPLFLVSHTQTVIVKQAALKIHYSFNRNIQTLERKWKEN